MKQIVLVANKTFEQREVEKPIPTATQALIRVHAVGVCGSDIHCYYGEHPFMHPPVVMGHEVSGEVIEIGANVSNIEIGDRVVLRPQKVCGVCINCKDGRYNICNELKVLGCQDTGGSSKYYAAEADLFYKIPNSIGYAEGTVIEPLSVGVHAAKKGFSDGIVVGKKVLVIGAGTIGNMVAQSALGMGAKDVIITDLSDFKLNIAKESGIKHTVNVKNEDLEKVITDIYGPDGADVVYECTASEAGLNQVLGIARKGIRIVIVGVYGKNVSVNMANVQDREYELIGTLMYTEKDYIDAIQLVEDAKVNLKAVITHEFPLEETAQAYALIDEDPENTQKVVLIV